MTVAAQHEMRQGSQSVPIFFKLAETMT
jgi:hypothetical protein